MRIRCSKCSRVRVLYRQHKCRRCWTSDVPRYRVVRLANGQTRRISSAKVARMVGRARGAEALHTAGKAHRWTSASARAAALKMWRLNPVNRNVGWRLGRPAKNRKPLREAERQQIRKTHAGPSSGTVWWQQGSDPVGLGSWRVSHSTGSRTISERAALIRLGYLPNPRGFVPTNVDPYPPTKSASTSTAPVLPSSAEQARQLRRSKP